jgi:putative ABC transport system substrate-binding protein
VVTNRRDLIAGSMAALLAGRPRAFAQQTAEKMPHIGILTPASSDKTPVFDAFRQELHRLDYTEGRDIALEFRFSAGDTARLPQLAAELAAERVEVIVADSTSAALSAHKATQTTPSSWAPASTLCCWASRLAIRSRAATSPGSR